MEAPDDWVDGSWTVDCVCGVNFDDGEEMVDCDECGVWVHTRCSGYVKSEKVFTCEKCRRKSKRVEDREEEVADSLVGMANKGGENMGSKRRLWQMRVERAHVQGVVGGESAGTGIFGSALWKASGYVPKKFGFQYKEFACWNDGNESGGNQGGGNESRGNEGGNGGALCLLKDKAGGSVSFGAGKRTEREESNEGGNGGALCLLKDKAGGSVSFGAGKRSERKESSEGGNGGALCLLKDKAGGSVNFGAGKRTEREESNEGGNGGALCLLKDKAGGSVSFGAGKRTEREESKKKKGEKGEEVNVRSSQQNSMKDRSSMKSTMSYYGKHKKEDSRTSMDVSGIKKARAVHVERDDSKKRSHSASRSVSTPSSDAKRSEFHEGKGFKVDQNVIPSGKHEKIKGNVPAQPSTKGFFIKGVGIDESKNTLAVSGQTSETSCAVSTHRISVKARQRDERDGLTASVQNSSKLCDGVQLLLDHNDSWSHSAKTKDNIDPHNLKDNERCINRIDRIRTEHLLEKESVAPHVKDSQNDYGSNGKMSVSCFKQNEAQADINDSVGFPHVQSSPCDEILDGLEHGPLPQKIKNLDKHTVAADCQNYYVLAPSEPVICQTNGQLVCLDNSHLVKESSSELEEVRHTRAPSESSEATLISSGQLTKEVSLRKSYSTSETTLLSGLSGTKFSDSGKTSDAQNYEGRTQQNIVSEHKASGKKDSSAGGFVKDRESYEKSMSTAKELPKSFASCVKTSNQSKISGSSNFTKTLSESKESVTFRSTKPSMLQNILSNSISGESASSLQPKNASYMDNTTTTSKLMQRSETFDHLTHQPSSKVNHTLQEDHPSTINTPATISDEELALLLHQELNSSARVPRVPRMRHAGSLPRLTSPTGANRLMKQSPSSSVGKDHGSVSKRKGKSVATEGTQNSQELQDESKNMKRSPLLPVERTNDSAHTADFVTKRELDNVSAPGVQSANKSNSPATSKQHVSSKCKSTQTASDDDSGTHVTRRTLPGLLSEIVTEPITYKELCGAVLPHWPYLRKNNGERYAYSSHSQAVLDCLRSRKEWARLVDRGPKSNAGRKRRERRFDAEAPSFGTGENDSDKKNSKSADCISVVESLRDQIPKGKRQMRKRRRQLALQEGGVKNVDGDNVSYGEDSSLSSSSSEKEGFSSGDGTIQWDDGTSSNGGPSGVSASD